MDWSSPLYNTYKWKLGDDVSQAANAYQAAAGDMSGQPTMGPTTLPPDANTANMLGGLFANLGSAVSQNPLYAQMFHQQVAQENATRERTQQTIFEGATQAWRDKRAATLAGLHDQYDVAAQRLRDQGQNELAVQMEEKRAKAAMDLEKLHDANALTMQNRQLASEYDRTLLSLGLRKNPQTGQLEMITLKAQMTPDQRAQRMGDLYKILQDPKTPKDVVMSVNQAIDDLKYHQWVTGMNAPQYADQILNDPALNTPEKRDLAVKAAMNLQRDNLGGAAVDKFLDDWDKANPKAPVAPKGKSGAKGGNPLETSETVGGIPGVYEHVTKPAIEGGSLVFNTLMESITHPTAPGALAAAHALTAYIKAKQAEEEKKRAEAAKAKAGK